MEITQKRKKYFIRSFAKLIRNEENLVHQFHYELKNDNFSYMKNFILFFPLFNLKNQPNIKIDFDLYDSKLFKNKPKLFKDDDKSSKDDFLQKLLKKENNYSKENDKNIFDDEIKKKIHFAKEVFKNKFENIFKDFSLDQKNNMKINKNIFDDDFEENNYSKNQVMNKNDEKKLIFDNPSNYFDFAVKNGENTKMLINQIEDIIKTMYSIIYQKPYSILLGRISIEQSKQKKITNVLPNRKNVYNNTDFYDGFGI